MYVCLYVYIYIYIFISRVCVCVCVRVRIHVRVYVYTYVCMYVCMYVCTYVCMHVRMFGLVLSICTRVCVYVHTHRAYIHECMNKNTCMSLCLCKWIFTDSYLKMDKYVSQCIFLCDHKGCMRTCQARPCGYVLMSVMQVCMYVRVDTVMRMCVCIHVCK